MKIYPDFMSKRERKNSKMPLITLILVCCAVTFLVIGFLNEPPGEYIRVDDPYPTMTPKNASGSVASSLEQEGDALEQLMQNLPDQPPNTEYNELWICSIALKEEDLSQYNQIQSSILRNTIYASHGYVFKDEPFKSYFESKSWYNPNPSFREANLTQLQKNNVKLLLDYERSLGGSENTATTIPPSPPARAVTTQTPAPPVSNTSTTAPPRVTYTPTRTPITTSLPDNTPIVTQPPVNTPTTTGAPFETQTPTDAPITNHVFTNTITPAPPPTQIPITN